MVLHIISCADICIYIYMHVYKYVYIQVQYVMFAVVLHVLAIHVQLYVFAIYIYTTICKFTLHKPSHMYHIPKSDMHVHI